MADDFGSLYTIMKEKSINDFFLKRYLNFIFGCMDKNKVSCMGSGTENHHILPKSLWPEFKNFKKTPWNKIILTYRQHFLCHWMLYKAYGGPMKIAFKCMIDSNKYNVLVTSRQYKIIREQAIEFISFYHKEYAKTDVGREDYNSRGKKTHSTKLENNLYLDQGRKISERANSIDPNTGLTNAKLRAQKVDWDLYRDNLGCSLREFISSRVSGENNPACNEETKLKISNTVKEYYKTNPAPFKGRTHSKEYKDKMSEDRMGEGNPCYNKIWVNNGVNNKRVYENEIPEGYFKGRAPMKKKIVKCPNCEKEGAYNLMSRYHFDNCPSNI